jgi:molybdate transport system permease protein
MLRLDSNDLNALMLSLQLASLSTLILLIIGTPLAWWLAHSQRRSKIIIEASVALPMILPPTVLGFYLLLALGPQGWIGQLTQQLGLGLLPFSFAGLLLASCIYSLPFVVQPLQNAFAALGTRPLEVAASLRASPMDRFFSVVLAQCRGAYLSAAVLGFAHTLGEFGVVLMIGGNIPGHTQVLSVQLYQHVEAQDYAQAQQLAALMLGFSFVVLLLVYSQRRGHRR